jgi:broad specificity phosphatase PhoE
MKYWKTVRWVIVVGIVICLPVFFFCWFCRGTPTTILLVRHADRPVSGEDALTPTGTTRAQELVHVARKSDLRAVYRTNTNRSRDTATPVATAVGLTPVTYDANDVAGVISMVLADHRGETVLVVGHSDTVPQIITQAGGPSLPNIAGNEFDDLFVVTIPRCRCGKVAVAKLETP